MHEKFNTVTPRKTIAHRRRSRPVRDFFASALDACATSLELVAAEARHHISRIEAAAVDQFQIDMDRIAISAETRQKLRDSALGLGMLGVMGYEEVEPMVRMWHIAEGYDVTLDDIRALGQIKMRQASDRESRGAGQ